MKESRGHSGLLRRDVALAEGCRRVPAIFHGFLFLLALILAASSMPFVLCQIVGNPIGWPVFVRARVPPQYAHDTKDNHHRQCKGDQGNLPSWEGVSHTEGNVLCLGPAPEQTSSFACGCL